MEHHHHTSHLLSLPLIGSYRSEIRRLELTRAKERRKILFYPLTFLLGQFDQPLTWVDLDHFDLKFQNVSLFWEVKFIRQEDEFF